MNENGNRYFISGFKPIDLNSYIRNCIGKLPKGVPECIKMAMIDEEEVELEHAWAWVDGESINGIHIRILAAESFQDNQMSIFIPWMASGIDIYLAYAFMNAVADKHPEAKFTACDENGNDTLEAIEISDEARDEEILRRLNIIALLLELPEKFVNIPCMAGQWKMDLNHYRKDFDNVPLEGQVTKVMYDIVDFIWYQEHPELDKISDEYERQLPS